MINSCFLAIDEAAYIRMEGIGLGFMVFNATFNSISGISWRSVLFVGETGVLAENNRPGASQ